MKYPLSQKERGYKFEIIARLLLAREVVERSQEPGMCSPLSTWVRELKLAQAQTSSLAMKGWRTGLINTHSPKAEK